MTWKQVIRDTIVAFTTLAGGIFLIYGYVYIEQYKLKAAAYKDFISTIRNIDAYSNGQVDAASAEVFIYGTDCAIEKVSDSLDYSSGHTQLTGNSTNKIILVLHKDLNLLNICIPSKPLTTDYMFSIAGRSTVAK